MNAEAWEIWLRRARSNLARARASRVSDDVLYEDLCFDAQQAVGKALRALLTYLGLPFPRTHSIGHLISLIASSGAIAVPERVKDAAVLTDYAVTTRYPGEWEPAGEEEYRRALELAEAVWEWVEGMIP